jgi:hypothetical protein
MNFENCIQYPCCLLFISWGHFGNRFVHFCGWDWDRRVRPFRWVLVDGRTGQGTSALGLGSGVAEGFRTLCRWQRPAPHAATSSPIFFWIYCHVGFQGLQTNNKILLCPVPFQDTTVANLVRLHEIVSQESHPISFSWNTIETPTHIYTTYVYLYLYMKTYLSL